MKLNRTIGVLLSLILVLGILPVTSTAAGGEPIEDWNYTVDEDASTVTLTKYVGTATAVTVPDSFEIDGSTYGTVLACGTVFRANTSIKSVTLAGGVAFLNNSMRLLFGECSALTSVDLSAIDTSDVIDMSYMFYNCSAIKTIDLSSFDTGHVVSIRGMFSGCTHLTTLIGYEYWDTSSVENMYQTFNKVAYSVSASTQVTIDMSRWDLSGVKNTGWCFQMCRAQTILVPDNIAVMSAGFMNHAIRFTGTSYTIPAGVKKIGYAHTFYDFATNDFVEFRVDEGNTAYKAIDGVLYSADGTEMLAVPRNKPYADGIFEIPEGVNFLAELSFSRNYNIHTVVLPDTYEIEYVPVYDERYIVYNDTGNLNAGTNLSVAIYCYTGITDYVVKETNPRYASLDGIIYSKDMTHVVAVPARYNRAVVVPEGVTEWDREAMWADGSDTVDNLLASCTGVSLPSTLTAISDDQLEMLNRLHSNRAGGANPFTVTVADGNTSFRIDENGALRRIYPGDVNGDGKVSVKDLSLIKKAITGAVSEGDIIFAAADIDGDGKITASDLSLLKKLIAGASPESLT